MLQMLWGNVKAVTVYPHYCLQMIGSSFTGQPVPIYSILITLNSSPLDGMKTRRMNDEILLMYM
jgi:hypothetical protein